jgi:hypothetical protein
MMNSHPGHQARHSSSVVNSAAKSGSRGQAFFPDVDDLVVVSWPSFSWVDLVDLGDGRHDPQGGSLSTLAFALHIFRSAASRRRYVQSRCGSRDIRTVVHLCLLE